MNTQSKLLSAAAAAAVLTSAQASAQQAELREVRLLGAPGTPEQSAVFEIVNESDREIGLLTVSCHLMNDAGKAIAVKAVRVRHVPPGSVIGDAAFPPSVHGADVVCRIVHQTSGKGR